MCESSKDTERGAVCPMHQKQGINIPPQPLCQLKAFTGSILDRIDHVLPGNKNKKNTGDMTPGCLCGPIKPVLKLSEFVGVVPLAVFHPTGNDGYSGKCQMVFRGRSFSAIINTFIILGFLGYLPFSFFSMKSMLSTVFQGTDLYTFTFHAVAMILDTTILLVTGRFLRCRFMKAWVELNEVYAGLCVASADLSRIKVGSYISVIIIMIEQIIVFVYTYLEVAGCELHYRHILINILEALRANLTWLIPTTLATLFFFICLLLRSLFNTISEMLTCTLKKPSPDLHTKIERVRILHERLCEAVSDFESYFGVQILITLCTACFMITVGAYSYIVQEEHISSGTVENAAWAAKGQMYGALLMVVGIVVGGELVKKAAVSSAPILNSLVLSVLDDKSQMQVAAFLQKISAFPTKISALRIMDVSTTFLASASKNIITYLLVLMQFKLSLDNKFCGREDLKDERMSSSTGKSFDSEVLLVSAIQNLTRV